MGPSTRSVRNPKRSTNLVNYGVRKEAGPADFVPHKFRKYAIEGSVDLSIISVGISSQVTKGIRGVALVSDACRTSSGPPSEGN